MEKNSITTNPLKRFLKNPYTIPVFLFILMVNLLINNAYLSLWDQDEAAYAGFACHILETGNWLIPEFMWSEPHRKTPFHFWSIATSFLIFGKNEFAVRFPSVMAVFCTILLTYYQGRKFFGQSVATLGCMILGSSFFLPSLAKVAVTDATLLLFETLCMFALLHVLTKKSWKWVLIFWLSFSLAVLTKGPPVFVVTGIFALLVLIFYSKRNHIFRLHPWFFLPLALSPLLLWGYMAWQHDDGAFIKWMVDWYILRRATNPVFGQTGPPGYYLLTFILAFLPFAMFIPSVIKKVFTRLKKNKYLFLGGWLIAGWLVYEFLASKLPAYALAAYPALALLMANEVLKLPLKQKMMNIPLKIGIALQGVFVFVLSAGLCVAAFYILPTDGIIAAASSSFFLLGLQAAGFYYLLKKQSFVRMTVVFLASGMLFFFSVWQFLIPSFEEERGATKRVAQYVSKKSRPGSEVVFSKKFNLPSFPFYLKKHTDSLRVNKDFHAVKKHYNASKPYVHIMHEDWRTRIKEKHPDWPVKQIKGWVSDRFKGSEYYILINKAARR